jgi:hypothetical protein
MKTKVGLGLMALGVVTVVSASPISKHFAPKAEEIIRVEAIQNTTDNIAIAGAAIFGLGAGLLLRKSEDDSD